MHLVSCKHRTSGLTDLMNLATRSMRSRTELIFQLVREKRMRTGETGCAQDDACLRFAIKNELPNPARNSGLFDSVRSRGSTGRESAVCEIDLEHARVDFPGSIQII